MSDELTHLQLLARAYGVETSYLDVDDHEQTASVESLRAVLGSLGCEVDGSTDLVAARVARERERLLRFVEPVTLLKNGTVPVVVPPGCAGFDVGLRLEGGGDATWGVHVADLEVVQTIECAGETFTVAKLPVPGPVPIGYHRLRIEVLGRTHDSLVLNAPPKVWSPPEDGRTQWGVFLPMYAVHGENSWGRGDFTDFRELLDWTAERGGDFVGTLPLLANEWEHGIDPSPYAPTSRRFWNEFHLDPRRTREYAASPEARALVESAEFREVIEAARAERLVDYERLVPLHRRVLEELTRVHFASDSERRAELREWMKQHPEADRFAQYRSRGEGSGQRWPEWGSGPAGGIDETLDFDTRAYQRHLYAQWQTTVQLEELGRDAGAALYLDFPLGVRRDGFDVWQAPGAFALTASGGAPPDPFFTKGQDWGFPPPHPDGLRAARYEPWIAGLRAHLSIAKLLRIDHAMGLHRLFWVPNGADAREGVYVRYEARELFAILAIESHRHEAVLVGENLGTCPPEVDEAMETHAMPGMYVVEFEIDADNADGEVLNPVPRDSLASLNTHDLPTFNAFWNALDVDDHVDLGLLTPEEAEASRASRSRMRTVVTDYLVRGKLLDPSATDDESAVLTACVEWMVRQRPRYAIVNLEDAWSEPLPQNVPGTWRERPNWRRRSQLTLEDLKSDERVRSLLATIARTAE